MFSNNVKRLRIFVEYINTIEDTHAYLDSELRKIGGFLHFNISETELRIEYFGDRINRDPFLDVIKRSGLKILSYSVDDATQLPLFIKILLAPVLLIIGLVIRIGVEVKKIFRT